MKTRIFNIAFATFVTLFVIASYVTTGDPSTGFSVFLVVVLAVESISIAFNGSALIKEVRKDG